MPLLTTEPRRTTLPSDVAVRLLFLEWEPVDMMAYCDAEPDAHWAMDQWGREWIWTPMIDMSDRLVGAEVLCTPDLDSNEDVHVWTVAFP